MYIYGLRNSTKKYAGFRATKSMIANRTSGLSDACRLSPGALFGELPGRRLLCVIDSIRLTHRLQCS
jgi:hypothetical protein